MHNINKNNKIDFQKQTSSTPSSIIPSTKEITDSNKFSVSGSGPVSKNLWTGTKSSMTYTKNHNKHSVDQMKNSLKTPDSHMSTMASMKMENASNIIFGLNYLLEAEYRDNRDGAIKSTDRPHEVESVNKDTIKQHDNHKGTNTVYRRNRLGANGVPRSAVPHGIMQDRVEKNKPYKPSNGSVDTWIDRMPQRKKNAGLTYMQKKSTAERNA